MVKKTVKPKAQMKGIGREQRDELLGNLMLTLSLWHAGRGSVAEAYLDSEMKRIAESAFKSLAAQGMMQLQGMLGTIMEQEAKKLEAANGADNVVSFPTGPREE